MFWNINNRVAAAGKLRAFFIPASITFRLTWLYTLSAFSLLFIYVFFMYYSLIKSLDKKDTVDIIDKASHLSSLIRNNPAFLEHYTAKFGLDELGRPAEFAKHHARVLDEAGRMVAQSPAFDKLGPALLFPAAVCKPEHAVKWRSANGRSFLLLAAKAQEGNDLEKMRTIQVAMDITHNEALIADYHHKLIGSLFAGIFICAGIGFSVARKALQPLGEITKVAERITVSHIAERPDPQRWPTELRVLAVAFNSMLDRLESSIVRLSQFSSNLAHELRTPINNLVGEAEIVISHGGTLDDFRHTLESSLEELARLSRITDSLLFLARAENPETRIERSRFDAFDEVKKLCVFYEWTAEEQGVMLTCSGSGVMTADLLLVNRAVSNLIANALKYTAPSGKVEIVVRRTDDHSTEIAVSDTGLGIDHDDLPYIFDRFFRADSARSKSAQGTGLGLAIVKSIMDLHGGAIDIQSKPGLGTTVALRFTS